MYCALFIPVTVSELKYYLSKKTTSYTLVLSVHYVVIKILWKNTEKVVPCSKYSELIFYRNIFLSLLITSNYILTQIKIIFLLKKLHSSKQREGEKEFCLAHALALLMLCFAHGP